MQGSQCAASTGVGHHALFTLFAIGVAVTIAIATTARPPEDPPFVLLPEGRIGKLELIGRYFRALFGRFALRHQLSGDGDNLLTASVVGSSTPVTSESARAAGATVRIAVRTRNDFVMTSPFPWIVDVRSGHNRISLTRDPGSTP